MQQIYEKAARIRLLGLDVDGILTDGKLYFNDGGEAFKVFHVLDGQGIKLLIQADIEVVIISSRQSIMVQKRMEELSVRHVYQGVADKLATLNTLLNQLDISYDQVAYMGDDLPDLPLIKEVGLGITVPNAAPQIQQQALWQTQRCGGMGAVREVCDLILAAQGLAEY